MSRMIDRNIRAWLRSVARRLEGSSEERRGVLDGLEEHIREALRERSGNQPATREDLRAVLEAIDPPAAFDGQLETDPRKTQADELGRAAAWTLAGTFAAIGAVFLLSLTGWITGDLAILVGMAGFLLAAVLGLVAWQSLLGRSIGIVSLVFFLMAAGLLPMRVESSYSVSGQAPVETYGSVDEER